MLAVPVSTTPAPQAPEPPVLPNSSGGARACLQALLFTLMAWAAVVSTGLGGTVGVAYQSLANKLAANAQHLQRHGGSSLASRAVRRDQVAAASVQKFSEDSQALVWDHTDAALPADELGLRIHPLRAETPLLSATQPPLTPRKRAHPSRAPPVLA
ncbi:MAG: hypothetical protein ACOVPA_17465 [Rubrivivax sp.]